MALPKQLMAARMTNSTVGNTIDNNIGALEVALADILGLTADSDVTESAFSLTNDGKVGKALVKQRAAGPVGWRMRDTTSNKEVRLVVNGTNFDIDENTGTEGTPSWTNRFRMAVADGALTGGLATELRMGLCPQGSGSANEYLRGDLTWVAPSLATIPSAKVRHSTTQAVSHNTTTFLVFDTEDWDTDTMHSTVSNTTRLVATTAGKYLVLGGVLWSANSSGFRQLDIYKIDSSGSVVGIQGRSNVNPLASGSHAQQVKALVELTAGQYVALAAYQTSGSTLNSQASASFAPFFSAHKVG